MEVFQKIRVFAPDEWRDYRDLRLRALADSPDAFGSTLGRELQFTDLEWVERLAVGSKSDRDLPLVAELGGKLAGLAWARIEDAERGSATIYQMWVAPEARRRGIGLALLEAAIKWARTAGVVRLQLRVTCGNSSAQRLYARAGFSTVGDIEPLRPGSAVFTEGMLLEIGDDAA